jgi:hypothetical protein
MSNCMIVKLNPAIAMNHRSMNEDRGWGIIVEHEGENSGHMLVRIPQFTLVIDLDGMEDQLSRLD